MTFRISIICSLAAGLAGCDAPPRTSAATPAEAEMPAAAAIVLPEVVSFNEHIQPVLSEYCYHCHGPDSKTREPKDAPLRLDRPEDAFAPRDDGRPVMIKGKPLESRLVKRILSASPDLIMPPPESHKTLAPREVALIKRWVEQGAEYEPHWAFTPIRKPGPPAAGVDWAANPIDRFIAAKLDATGLKPNPPDDPRRFHRRLTLDLTGLPPTPHETDVFVQAYAEDAQVSVEAEAARLLATTASAEHFSRHWLDAARYADTHGIHIDNYRAIWPYRDWVVRAFQANMPWDQFTTEQIAGDLLPDKTLDQLVATGFSRCLATTGEGGAISEEYDAIYATDRVETMSAIWLGLTTGCAACHDHKFDPVSTKEFYSLTAFFRNTPMTALDRNKAEHPPNVFVPLPADRERWAALGTEIADVEKQVAAGAADAGPLRTRLDGLKKQQAALRARGSVSLVMEEKKDEPFAHVLTRGVYSDKGEKVSPGTPAVLPPMPADAPKNRLGLARWLTDPANPLPARVTMNRTWHYFFGTGIVETNADFGIMGARPSHPKLLDWLAAEFIDSKWNYRHMLQLMATSAAYRQSGVVTPEKLELDPSNQLLARGPRHRLDAEQIRDLALAASGLLSPQVGGPPVKPYQPEGIWAAVAMKESNTRNYKQDAGESLYRRSLYTMWKRTAAPPSMEILNAPSRETFCVQRDRTNTPLQALVLLNDPQFVEASRELAAHALKAAGDFDGRLDFISLRLVGRAFGGEERTIVRKSFEAAAAEFKSLPDEAAKLATTGAKPPPEDADLSELAAWTLVASQILNLDETITR